MLRRMSQLEALGLKRSVWSPTELNRHLRQLLEGDYRMADLWVAGEVTNLSSPASGHLYFTLRDSEAAVRCVIWRPDVSRLPRLPSDGEALEAHGHISVYEAGGQYQLYADSIHFAGEGELFKQFLKLKQRLESEGLFDAERKRPLPEWPRRIGLVTSPTGAALRDVVNVLRRRYPLAEVILAPAVVQGEAAPEAIEAAMIAVNHHSSPDVVLLVRGGGSMEDLWAFNSEQVVRAVVESAAPVVTGVGHETDVILADYAADLRAPTPSAAAEVVTPDQEDLRAALHELSVELARIWDERRRSLQSELLSRRASLALASPRARVDGARQRVDELLLRATAAMRHTLALRKSAIGGLIQTLSAVGPETVLSRGYAIIRRTDDRTLVRSVRQVAEGDGIELRVQDGSFDARVDGADS
jgi:exodeoxyribonuclease VII large subunit